MAAIEEQDDSMLIEPRRRRPKHKAENPLFENRKDDLVWNVLTVLVWLGIASAVMAFTAIIANPQSLPESFRPFPPTLVSPVHIPTHTATLAAVNTGPTQTLALTP